MPSRSGKERKNDNPLSKARRVGGGRTAIGRRSKQSAATTAAETNAKEIWFRKTGGGMACFVAYYAQVLKEVDFGESVIDSASLEIERGTCSTSTNNGIGTNAKRSSTAASGLGLSRAAQRRKRRKGGVEGNDSRPAEKDLAASTNDDDDVVAQSRAMTDKKAHVDLVTDHPLWKAVTVASVRQPSLLQSSVVARFFAALTRPLPLTFRIRQTAHEKNITKLLQEVRAYNDLESTIVKVEPLQGRPAEAAAMSNEEYQPLARLDVYQAACAKAALPDAIKDLLVEASQNGCIARQELGSMLPVAALVQAGAFASFNQQQRERSLQVFSVLDMCASPGSKTLQVLEVLRQLTTASAPTSKPPSSSRNARSKKFMLIANDIMESRLGALQQAVERSGVTEKDSITYTCQDATKFSLRVAVSSSSCKQSSLAASSRTEPLLFDAILCDVPCSGDGTIRKDKHILPRWTPAIGNELHSTQLALLYRALQLLKPGGMVCYSTCSMNPVENEAVVAAAIARFNKTSRSSQTNDQAYNTTTAGTVELVECPSIPGVVLREGLSTWKVAQHNLDSANDEDGTDNADSIDPRSPNVHGGPAVSTELLTFFASFDDAAMTDPGSMARTLWPPSTETSAHLSRCRRLWPHDADTGGFFLALIRKSV
jgi:16S rRNA C967 or C1407 C5-methylase (RsmB/RsmF family)